jgi:hypothetical protein
MNTVDCMNTVESPVPGGVEEQTSSAGLRSSPVKKRQRLGRMCGRAKENVVNKMAFGCPNFKQGARLAFIDLFKHYERCTPSSQHTDG